MNRSGTRQRTQEFLRNRHERKANKNKAGATSQRDTSGEDAQTSVFLQHIMRTSQLTLVFSFVPEAPTDEVPGLELHAGGRRELWDFRASESAWRVCLDRVGVASLPTQRRWRRLQVQRRLWVAAREMEILLECTLKAFLSGREGIDLWIVMCGVYGTYPWRQHVLLASRYLQPRYYVEATAFPSDPSKLPVVRTLRKFLHAKRRHCRQSPA